MRLLGGTALLLAVAVAVGATLLWSRTAGPGDPNPDHLYASAADTGPVGIIDDDPTCDAWWPINSGLATVEESIDWLSIRREMGPADTWTAEQRRVAEIQRQTIINSVTPIRLLSRQTPHRLLRILYDYYLASSERYRDQAELAPPARNWVELVLNQVAAAISGICGAAETGAHERALLVPPDEYLSNTSHDYGGLEPPGLLLSDHVCNEWVASAERFDSGLANWRSLDPDLAGSEWTPAHRLIETQAQAAIAERVTWWRHFGRNSDNPAVKDIAFAAAVYGDAYSRTAASYVPRDFWLIRASLGLSALIIRYCQRPE